MLRLLLTDCQNPPVLADGRADGLLIERPLCLSIVSELIQLRAAQTIDQKKLIDLVAEMTFSKAIHEIGNMIEDMGRDVDCNHVVTIANAIKAIKFETEKMGSAHGRG